MTRTHLLAVYLRHSEQVCTCRKLSQVMSETFYTDPEIVRETLFSRSHLMPEVEAWWRQQGWDIPHLPHAGAAGNFCRNLATFRYEDAVFSLLCRRAGLVPIWHEHVTDKYSSLSSVKRSYAKYLACTGRGRNGGAKLTKIRPIRDLVAIDGKRLSDIMMDDGTSLVDHHHGIFDRFVGQAHRNDISAWLSSIGRARDYYLASVSLFIAHGVLFEDYHGGESGDKLDSFTTDIFEPAFHAVYERFGVKPIIVRMPWFTEMKYYPADLNWQEHGIIPAQYLRQD